MANIDFTHKTIENQTAGISVSKATFQSVFDAIRKIVDKSYRGSTEKLDADLCGGSEYTAADVLAKLKTVDGPGSGLDADTVTSRGIGANSSPVAYDLNVRMAGGFYTTLENTANIPSGMSAYGTLVHIDRAGVSETQIYIDANGAMAVRHGDPAAAPAWHPVFTYFGYFHGDTFAYLEPWGPGNIYLASSVTGMPFAAWWQCLFIGYGGDRICIASQVGGAGVVYVRFKDSGTWGSWYKMWSEGNDGNGGQPPAPKPKGYSSGSTGEAWYVASATTPAISGAKFLVVGGDASGYMHSAWAAADVAASTLMTGGPYGWAGCTSLFVWRTI